jgi:hypothetical protein
MLVASVSSALTSTNRDTPQLILSPSSSLCPRSPDLHRATGVSPSSTHGLIVSLSPFKGPGVLSRRNQPFHGPNFPFPALVCAQLLAGARLRRRRAIPAWSATFWGLCVVSMPTLVFATLPQTSLSSSRRPGALARPRPHLRRVSAVGASGVTAGGQGVWPRADC